MKFNHGDIFLLNTSHGVRYFQYIEDDSGQLNSNVIRVFKALRMV
jgi:hypothetical protein